MPTTPQQLRPDTPLRRTDEASYPHLAGAAFEVVTHDPFKGELVVRYTRLDGTGGTLKASTADFVPIWADEKKTSG
jgi:hypothetical protein